jgi:hypothetical protein
MKKNARSAAILVVTLVAAASVAFSQNENQGKGQSVVTILPKKSDTGSTDVSQQSVQVTVNGKQSQISAWQPLRGAQAPVELVVLIDDGARASLGREFDEIRQFVDGLPPNVKVALAYMENGRAALSSPLSENHAAVAKDLHLPVGVPGSDASPYFCLSDLAKNWPSTDRSARREVIMITDGVDYYQLRYDPDDPYVQAAVKDAVRANLVVYSIYWRNSGRIDRTGYENNAGQNLLLEVTDSTGGNSYWIGMGNPVTLQPYFEDFSHRLNNQYELGFSAPLHGKADVASLKVKVNAPDVKVTAPQKTWLAPGGAVAQE